MPHQFTGAGLAHRAPGPAAQVEAGAGVPAHAEDLAPALVALNTAGAGLTRLVVPHEDAVVTRWAARTEGLGAVAIAFERGCQVAPGLGLAEVVSNLRWLPVRPGRGPRAETEFP